MLITVKNIARLSPAHVVPELFGAIVRSFDFEGLKALTPTDVAIFFTPEGQLYENGDAPLHSGLD